MFHPKRTLRSLCRIAVGVVLILIFAWVSLGQQADNADAVMPVFNVKLASGDIWLADSGGEDEGNNGKQSIYMPGHIFMIPTSYYSGNTVLLQARRADSSGTTNLRIRTYDDGDLTEAMTILGNGNVGIGKTNPGSRLHIQGTRISDATGSTANGVLRIRDDSGHTMVLDGNQLETVGSRLFLNHRTDNDIILAVGGGNVGIRTGNPASPLTVDGVIETTQGGVKFPDGTIQTTAAGGAAVAAADAENEASGPHSVIAGGTRNIASGTYSAIGGGQENDVNGRSATIGGGEDNQCGGSSATIAGGSGNGADFAGATVGGGYSNWASEVAATVSGGRSNAVNGKFGTVPGGCENAANGDYSFAAGYRAVAYEVGCFVWSDSSEEPFESSGDDQFLIRASGGVGINTNEPSSALTVAGTIESTEGGIVFPDGTTQATAYPGMGFENTLDDWGSFIGGGAWNSALNYGATAVGGIHNTAGSTEVDGSYATIAGGLDNYATHKFSVIVGGEWNYSQGQYAVVGGGFSNRATAAASAIVGGTENEALGEGSFVGGGTQNDAEGKYSVVPGGLDNLAIGTCSYAAGQHAQAFHEGTFVWADYSIVGNPDGPHDSLAFPLENDPELQDFLGPNQFLVRATGGSLFASGVDVDGNVTAGVKLAAGGTSWDILCDRALKTGMTELDARDVLTKLAGIPVTEWSLVAQDPSIRHIGPMAQDFHVAFGLGTSDRFINSGDVDGIALVSIQALYEITQEQASEIDELRAEIDELRQLVNDLVGGSG